MRDRTPRLDALDHDHVPAGVSQALAWDTRGLRVFELKN